MKTPETKAIHYAYPSSPMAHHFGRSRQGCYYIQHGDAMTGPAARVEDAESAADHVDLPWCPRYQKYPLRNSRFAA